MTVAMPLNFLDSPHSSKLIDQGYQVTRPLCIGCLGDPSSIGSFGVTVPACHVERLGGVEALEFCGTTVYMRRRPRSHFIYTPSPKSLTLSEAALSDQNEMSFLARRAWRT